MLHVLRLTSRLHLLMSENKDCYRIVRVGRSFLLSAFCLLLSIRLTSLLHLLMSENKDCYRVVRVALSFLLSAFCFLPSAFHSPHFPPPFVDERKQRLFSDASFRSFISAFCLRPSSFETATVRTSN